VPPTTRSGYFTCFTSFLFLILKTGDFRGRALLFFPDISNTSGSGLSDSLAAPPKFPLAGAIWVLSFGFTLPFLLRSAFPRRSLTLLLIKPQQPFVDFVVCFAVLWVWKSEVNRSEDRKGRRQAPTPFSLRPLPLLPKPLFGIDEIFLPPATF